MVRIFSVISKWKFSVAGGYSFFWGGGGGENLQFKKKLSNLVPNILSHLPKNGSSWIWEFFHKKFRVFFLTPNHQSPNPLGHRSFSERWPKENWPKKVTPNKMTTKSDQQTQTPWVMGHRPGSLLGVTHPWKIVFLFFRNFRKKLLQRIYC